MLRLTNIYDNLMKKINIKNPNNIISYSIIAFIIVIIVIFLLYIRNTISLNTTTGIFGGSSNGKNCNLISRFFTSKPPLISAVDSPELSNHGLRDFYIKSAYNCCCSGKFKNDFVNICALNSCIEQGVRMLDFELYSIDNKPVVAASSINSYKTKETYNSIPIESVFATINQKAFSSGSCPNYNDPLILHFRISSQNIKMYNALANIISSMFNNRVLGPTYSNEYNGKNLGEIPILSFKQKIIIFVDSSNPVYKNTKLYEYINMTSNSPFLHLIRYDNVKYTQDLNLENFNKKNMSIVLPDLSITNNNPNFNTTNNYGCQMLGMCFQNKDSNLQVYNDFFNASRFAFVLKPEKMRYIPISIEKPPNLPEKYSYQPRNISGQFYDFQI